MGALYGYRSAGFHPNGDAFGEMAKALDFRGEIAGTYTDPGLSMGVVKHSYEKGSRLVLDKERSIIAACEGEIYNARELARTIKSPPSLSDQYGGFDLIPSLYFEKGKDFPRLINGVFTIALWDAKIQTLYLVRDHLGSHSVFYALKNDFFCFSTTIKAILSSQCVPAAIDHNCLNIYLASLAIPPPDTMFKDIFAVRPGHMAVFSQGTVSQYSYWPFHTFTENYEMTRQDFVRQIKELFIDAVTIRADKADVTGALVSGGVDTSAIVSVLCTDASVPDLKGFSIAFKESAYSDDSLQKFMYHNFRINPHTTVLSPEKFADALLKGAAYLDNPVNDVAYAGMLVAMEKAAEEGCRIVFEGEGSDEIFCTGHSRGELSVQTMLRLPFFLRRLFFGWAAANFSDGNALPGKVIRFTGRLGMKDLERRSTWIPGFTPKRRRQLLGDFADMNPYATADAYYKETRLQDPINIYQYGLTRLFLPDDLLFKNERMAAAKGIINRTPFVDYRLVEAGFKIPARFKLKRPSRNSDGTKLIFKEAIKGMIPDEILNRKKKRGFSQPSDIWFRGPLKGFVYDHLFSCDSRVIKYLDPGAVKRIYKLHLNQELSVDYFINSLLILELWMRQYV